MSNIHRNLFFILSILIACTSFGKDKKPSVGAKLISANVLPIHSFGDGKEQLNAEWVKTVKGFEYLQVKDRKGQVHRVFPDTASARFDFDKSGPIQLQNHSSPLFAVIWSTGSKAQMFVLYDFFGGTSKVVKEVYSEEEIIIANDGKQLTVTYVTMEPGKTAKTNTFTWPSN